MKIFITGGTGFIGSHVIPKLVARDHRVLLLQRRSSSRRAQGSRSITLLRGDLKNIGVWEKAVRKFKPDAIVHLAWEGLESYDFSAITSARNLAHSLNLVLLAAEIRCKKFLSVGSCWEYGETVGRTKESSFSRKANHVPHFVAVKRALQSLGEQIAHENSMQFLWARLFFTYGPGQKSRALIPSMANSFRKGIVPEIKNKRGVNDFVYVDDAADALVAMLEKSRKLRATYNVGSGRLTSVARIANCVARQFGHTPILKEPKRPKGFWADISKIRREIGWRPKTSIEKGVQKTIEYLHTKT